MICEANIDCEFKNYKIQDRNTKKKVLICLILIQLLSLPLADANH